MDSVNVKGILYFFSGMILGAAGAGYAVYRVSKSHFEKENRAAVDELAAYYHNKYEKPKKAEKKEETLDDSSSKEKDIQKVGAEEEKSYEEVSGIYRPTESSKVVTDYRSISGDNSSDSARPASRKKGKKKKPYVIDKDVFEENAMNYDKRFIIFYEADRVLVDEESEEVIDIWTEIGEQNLNNDAAEDDEIFIANDQYTTLYMVTIEHRAWAELDL